MLRRRVGILKRIIRQARLMGPPRQLTILRYGPGRWLALEQVRRQGLSADRTKERLQLAI